MIKGISKLTGFIIERERVTLLLWLLCLVGITAAVPVAFGTMYETQADRAAMAVTMANPAMTAMVGPGYGLSNYTTGAMFAQMMLTFTVLAVAVMNIFLVIRQTRRDEERGRIEVLRSLPVGRLSSLSATMVVAVITNVLLGVLSAIFLAVLGIESIDLAGSVLYGASLCVSGIFFAAIAALFAQLCVTSRGAMGYSLAVMGILYLMRAVGDMNSEALACISPMGLILRTQVYVKNEWWPVPIVLLISLVVTAAAFYLNSIRDMDQGFIPVKPGRKNASRWMLSPVGLGFRLLRTTIIAWIVTVVLIGASYGSIMGDLEGFLTNNEALRQALPVASGYSMTQLFITMLMSVIAMMSAVPCLSIMLKLRSEEKRNHTEHMLSRAVSRGRLMAGYFIMAMIASFLMMFLSVLGLWGAASSVVEEAIPFGSMMESILIYLPAQWVMIGITVLLIGVWPKKTILVWIYLGASFLLVYLGRIIGLKDWVSNLSPFGMIPQLPVEEINYVTLGLMTAVAAACMVIGFIGYKKRDIEG